MNKLVWEGHELWLLTTCRVRAALVHVFYIHYNVLESSVFLFYAEQQAQRVQVSCLRSCKTANFGVGLPNL